MTREASWICTHLGAREHYAVPRALHRHGRLRLMVTDAWIRPRALVRNVPGPQAARLAERFHPELAGCDVIDFTGKMVRRELSFRLQRRGGWDVLIERNEWFQRNAADALARVEQQPGERVVLFAHSYSARLAFRVARSRGWKTVLGQIDAGPEHFSIARQLAAQSPQYGAAPPGPPPRYFEAWREECELADRIVVNSDWARDSVIKAGVDAAKLAVVPIAYEPEGPAAAVAPHEYPARFSPERPMRVLYVGSVSVAKGAAALLESLALVGDLPISLRMVGQVDMTVPLALREQSAIEWVGPVSRSDVMEHYRGCDVLVFPSHSDGFGMAQVEAQARGLPVIASRHCGRVVHDGVTGLILPEVSAPAVASALRQLAAQPEVLAMYSRNALRSHLAGVASMGAALLQCEPA